VNGPAGVMALVLAETVTGGLTLLFLSPLWGEVRRGFFLLTGAILLVLALAQWRSTAAGLSAGSEAGRWSDRLSAALVGAILLWTLLLLLRRPLAARVAGLASVALAGGVLVAMAGTAEGSPVVAMLQLLAGAAFLGGVTDGLLLGHWYLTERSLPRRPIDRTTTFLIVAVALEAAAVVTGGFGPAGDASQLNPLLTAAGLAPWIALGMIGATALIAIVIRAALRGTRASAVQAATGFFYLAVVTALTAEFAAKIRFLP
jgi:hypothetical protein